jgi:hypothetical protein
VIVHAIRQAREIFARITSYATYRIAETIRVLLIALVITFNFFPVTPVMIVFLAVLNDAAILSIAYDRVRGADTRAAWDMRTTLVIAAAEPLALAAAAAFPGADSCERWWPAPSVLAPSMTPLPSTQRPQSAIWLVSMVTGGPGLTPGASSRPMSRMTACPASSHDSTLAHWNSSVSAVSYRTMSRRRVAGRRAGTGTGLPARFASRCPGHPEERRTPACSASAASRSRTCRGTCRR